MCRISTTEIFYRDNLSNSTASQRAAMKFIGQPEMDAISPVYGDLGTRAHNYREHHFIIQANCYLSWSIYMYNILGIFTFRS